MASNVAAAILGCVSRRQERHENNTIPSSGTTGVVRSLAHAFLPSLLTLHAMQYPSPGAFQAALSIPAGTVLAADVQNRVSFIFRAKGDPYSYCGGNEHTCHTTVAWSYPLPSGMKTREIEYPYGDQTKESELVRCVNLMSHFSPEDFTALDAMVGIIEDRPGFFIRFLDLLEMLKPQGPAIRVNDGQLCITQGHCSVQKILVAEKCERDPAVIKFGNHSISLNMANILPKDLVNMVESLNALTNAQQKDLYDRLIREKAFHGVDMIRHLTKRGVL